MIGKYRHSEEDPRAVKQAVVYLTTEQDEIFRNGDVVETYKYLVEIDENDPDLYLDEKDYQFRQECNKDFEESDNTKWYFYLKPINVSDTLEWNGHCYTRIPNF
ncbi:hypothetical protein [Paenibacillus sp. FSL R10-2734]|uniref:hypothetical protein n=1 Tax=Paenibacillus sp. FSL R10-2734 TaxID=2954691 RepID=UPI0030DC0EFD